MTDQAVHDSKQQDEEGPSETGGAGSGRRKSAGRTSGTGSASTARSRGAGAGKKRRFLWDDLLHRRFVGAIYDYGARHATPKALFQLMHPAPAHMTSDHIKSHLQKYRANYGRSRDAFLLEYERALRESRARAREIEARTGVTPFPPGFSTFPVQMPPHLQSGEQPPHDMNGDIPPGVKSRLQADGGTANLHDYGTQAILQGGAKKGAALGLKPLTQEDRNGLLGVEVDEGMQAGSRSGGSRTTGTGSLVSSGGRSRRGAAGASGRGAAGAASARRSGRGGAGGVDGGKGSGSIGVGGPTVLDLLGQSELRAPAVSALALHTADVESRSEEDPAIPLGAAWRAVRDSVGPASVAVGAASRALEDFVTATR